MGLTFKKQTNRTSFNNAFISKSEKRSKKNQETKRALFFIADQSGCGTWRMEWPRTALNSRNRASIQALNQMITDPKFYLGQDAIVLQRQMTDVQLEFSKFLKSVTSQIKRQKDINLIFDIDDICWGEDIPHYNAMRDGFQNDKIKQNFKSVVHNCDEMRVVSKYMAEYYSDKLSYNKMTIIPDLLPKHWVDGFYDEEKKLKQFEKNKKRPRVLWAGSATHLDARNRNGQKDDFSDLLETIVKTSKQFQWVFMGGVPLRLKNMVDKGIIEAHPWVNIHDYPRVKNELGVQACFAPLTKNHFNRAKANIKLTEAGALGIPGAYQDLEPYQEAPFKFNTGEELIDQLTTILKDETNYLKYMREGRKLSEKYFIEKDENLDMLHASYFTKYDSDERKVVFDNFKKALS